MPRQIARSTNHPSVGILAFALGLTYAGMVVGPAALAQVPVPVGAAFQVNVVTASDQFQGVPAMDAAGNFVVVWTSKLQDGSLYGVFGRRFNATGAPLATEFQVNAFTSGSQADPVVDMHSTGAFVVAWVSAQDGSNTGVFARRFDSAGTPVGSEFQVNSYTPNYQFSASVAIAGGGDFVIAWSSQRDGVNYDAVARRFSSTGVPQAPEFQVNTFTVGDQREPDIDVGANGDFVIVWTTGEVPYFSIHGQRFNSLGISQGPEMQLSTYTGRQNRSRVGLEADGDFVVVWASYGQDGSEDGVFGRRFNSLGAATSSEIQLNSYETSNQTAPRLAVEADGDFVVAWMSAQDGDSNGIFMRRLWASATITGPELQANVQTSGGQVSPAVASDSDGDVVVVWTDSFGTSANNVVARRFHVPAVLDIDGDGEILPLTDGLLSLRFSFGFTGSTLTTGAIAPGCTRCDATTIVAYLQTLR